MQLTPMTEVSLEKKTAISPNHPKVDSAAHFTGSQPRSSPEVVFDGA